MVTACGHCNLQQNIAHKPLCASNVRRACAHIALFGPHKHLINRSGTRTHPHLANGGQCRIRWTACLRVDTQMGQNIGRQVMIARRRMNGARQLIVHF